MSFKHYVLASAITYTFFGIMAGLFGSNLQVFFQDTRVILLFSAIFVLLGSSMFGYFHLQIPSVIQTKLVLISFRQQRGNIFGAGMMGMLSALTVGPCVTAPLAGALIYIGQSGDAMTGGLALFSLGIGMGIPLLVIGTSAGKWLPKTGTWINATKAIFGMGLLAVAVWLLGRILPPLITLLLWSALLIMPLLYLSWKSFGKVYCWWHLPIPYFCLWGLRHTRNVMPCNCYVSRPLFAKRRPRCFFKRSVHLKSYSKLWQIQKAQGRWLMLDFYADWCASCKEMALYTFNDPRIKQALLQRFKLIGPPAILFFGPEQQERKAFRVIGYMNADNFLKVIKNALGDIQK